MEINYRNIQDQYTAPEMCVIDACVEGIICESGSGTIAPWEPDPSPLGVVREF